MRGRTVCQFELTGRLFSREIGVCLMLVCTETKISFQGEQALSIFLPGPQ